MTLGGKIGQVSQSLHFGSSKAFDKRIIADVLGSTADDVNIAKNVRLQHLAVERGRLPHARLTG